MSAMIIDGKVLAKNLRANIAGEVAKKGNKGWVPGLGSG